MLCIVLMFNFCVIAMRIVCMLTNDTKTLGYDLWIKKRERERNRKIQNPHIHVLMAILPNFDLGPFGLCQWLDNVTKHIRTPFESKKLKSNQNRIQIELT